MIQRELEQAVGQKVQVQVPGRGEATLISIKPALGRAKYIVRFDSDGAELALGSRSILRVVA